MKSKNVHDINLKPNREAIKDERIKFQSLLFSKYIEKINHVDELRQRNMNYALIIFSGLFAIGLKLNKIDPEIILSSILTLVMIIFCLLDRRLHKISHQYQSLCDMHYANVCSLLNNSNKKLKYKKWDKSWRKPAQWFALQPLIFYSLIIGGILSFPLFRMI